MSKKTLKDAHARLTQHMSDGRMATPNRPAAGDVFDTIDDPVYQKVMMSAPALLNQLKVLEDQIGYLTTFITTAKNGTGITTIGGQWVPASQKDKRDYIAAWKLKISEYRAQQAVVLDAWEKEATEALKASGIDTDMDLTSITPRTNLPKQPTSSPN